MRRPWFKLSGWRRGPPRHREPARVLLCGWFSFEHGGNTAGDTMALEVLCRWLEEQGIPYDVARESAARGNGVDWAVVDPGSYRHLIFVCGPIVKNWDEQQRLFERFRGKTELVGLNVSLITQPPGLKWNPFDVVFGRDGVKEGSPDMAFAFPRRPVPVAGLILRGHQGEYGEENCLHEMAEQQFADLLAARSCAVVPIDTVVPGNRHGLRSTEEVEALINKCDLVLTTRLHGGVIALKNGVPPIAIDQIRGGAKVLAGMSRVGWPNVFKAEELAAHDRRLTAAFEWSLSPQARRHARACTRRARALLRHLKGKLTDVLLAD